MKQKKPLGVEDRDKIIRNTKQAECALLGIERVIRKNHPHPANGFTIVLIHTIIRILRGMAGAALAAYEPSDGTFDAEFYDLEVQLWFPKGIDLRIQFEKE